MSGTISIGPSSCNGYLSWAALTTTAFLISISLRSSGENSALLIESEGLLYVFQLNSEALSIDLVVHFLTVALAAILLEVGFPKLRSKLFLSKWRICQIVALIAIEITQTFIPGRHPHFADLFVRIGAVYVAFLICNGVGARLSNLLARQTISKTGPWVRVAFLSLLSGGWIYTATEYLRDVQTLNWDPDYSLQFANEATGNRPWKGNIAEVSIKVIDQLPKMKKPTPPITLTASRLRDCAACFESQGAVESTTEYVSVEKPAIISYTDSTLELCEVINRTRSFELVATIMPKNLTQVGPARIVSYSADPFFRNLTLGQEGDDYHFRIRNNYTGPRTLSQEVIIKDAVTGDWQTLRLVYRQGRITVSIDGDVRIRRDHLNYAQHLGLGNGHLGIAHCILVFAIAFYSPNRHSSPSRAWASSGTLLSLLIIPVVYSLPIFLSAEGQFALASIQRSTACLPWTLGIVLTLYPLLRRIGC